MSNRGSRFLRRMLRALLGVLMVAIAAVIVVVLVLVLRDLDVTADMAKEAREAVLLAEMDSAVQGVGVRVDRWLAGELEPTTDHPVLDSLEMEAALARFTTAAGELRSIIKPEESHLVDEMSQLFADYRATLVSIDEVRAGGPDRETLVTTLGAVERSFRESLLDLQNEEIEHLAASIETVSANQSTLRWLVPGLLVLVLVLALGLGNVTDRSRRLEEAEELNRSRNDFIASVSHELRTPLSVVVGLAHEMHNRFDSFEGSEIREFAGMISDESREVASIVDDLLVAARYESGQLTVSREPVELRTEVLRVISVDNALVDLDISVGLDSEVVAVADRLRVRQILRNLLSNAGRYGGGRIEVGMYRDEGRATVWVADDGPGISPEDVERVFEPYQRSHEVAGIPASVGLGLSVSRQLARAMGGDLTYRYDLGSRLELELPSLEPSPVAA